MARAQQISGWGRYPEVEATLRRARTRGDLCRLTGTQEPAGEARPRLAQGSRRTYGDGCLAGQVVSTLTMNHLLSFDAATGLLVAEAGLTLDDLLRFSVPRGWFLPVTPGTKHPTLGGCVAADVHGKNHHLHGSIGAFVERLDMVLADGTCARCSRRDHPELFAATLGGMGLTGFIYAVALRLTAIESSYIETRTVRTANLAETCAALRDTQDEYVYSVAWVDLLCSARRRGRGLVILGNHARSGFPGGQRRLALHQPPKLTVPEHLAALGLNRATARLFNGLYYRRQVRRDARAVVHYDPFFYPLDVANDWNRVYGRRGFLQYQFAVPFEGGEEFMAEFLDRIGRHRPGCTLAVLKTFGPQDGLLSFPMAGYTLAMDFPVANGRIVEALSPLTDRVVEAGGRLYLAKDAIMERRQFEAMYPRLDEFRQIRRQYDPEGLFGSVQSDRLGLT